MRRRLLTPFLVLFALVAASSRADERLELVVITHPSRSAALDLDELRRIYLKQRRFWPDDAPIVAINHEPGPVRAVFDRLVLGAELDHVVTYWDRRYFEGVFPPITLASDEAVRRYVASKPDAIGYVAASMVDASVRIAFRLPSVAVTPAPLP